MGSTVEVYQTVVRGRLKGTFCGLSLVTYTCHFFLSYMRFNGGCRVHVVLFFPISRAEKNEKIWVFWSPLPSVTSTYTMGLNVLSKFRKCLELLSSKLKNQVSRSLSYRDAPIFTTGRRWEGKKFHFLRWFNLKYKLKNARTLKGIISVYGTKERLYR